MTYTVEIKNSASRRNPAVSRLARQDGTRHTFPSKLDAKEWTEELNKHSVEQVYLQNASPMDSDLETDGYLVGE